MIKRSDCFRILYDIVSSASSAFSPSPSDPPDTPPALLRWMVYYPQSDPAANGPMLIAALSVRLTVSRVHPAYLTAVIEDSIKDLFVGLVIIIMVQVLETSAAAAAKLNTSPSIYQSVNLIILPLYPISVPNFAPRSVLNSYTSCSIPVFITRTSLAPSPFLFPSSYLSSAPSYTSKLAQTTGPDTAVGNVDFSLNLT